MANPKKKERAEDYESKIREIMRQDPRYNFEAYDFMFAALEYTQRMVAKAREIEDRRRGLA